MALALFGCGTTPDTTLHPEPAPSYVPQRHPFASATLLQEGTGQAAEWQAGHDDSDWLNPITTTPQAVWLNGPPDLAKIPALARQAVNQQALMVLVAYYIPNRGCSDYAEGAPTPQAYIDWTTQLISSLGQTSAVIILEPDALAADCFDPERAALLTQTVEQLSAAGHFVYIDAGHPKWRTTGETAERLLGSGIQTAEGFAVNVANRQTTQDSHAWGVELSDLVGDREFVIDTSRNGMGPPPDDPSRDDEWCNPSQQALGSPPTTNTGLQRVAALLWIKRPGESDGKCGGEDTYEFTPNQARTLIANEVTWVPQPLRAQAQAAEFSN
jgi:endoglucanase